MSMLDDFVEHSTGPSGLSRLSSTNQRDAIGYGALSSSGGFNEVQYEGFEQDEDGLDKPVEELAIVQALETGFIPSSRTASSLPPLFSLSLVQYSPPSSILYMTTANNILFLATRPLSIVIIDLNKPEEIVTVDLPRPAHDKASQIQRDSMLTIQKLFADPTARHLIITTTSGDSFYLPISPGNPAVQSRRPRPLRIRQAITAVGWSPVSGTASTDSTSGEQSGKGDMITPPSTDVLLGCQSGAILSLPLPPQDDIFKTVNLGKSMEKDLQTVYQLLDSQPITGVAFGFWGVGPSASKSARKDKRAWVVFTTKDRLYEVQGTVTTMTAGGKGGGWPEEVFRFARESALKFQELPGEPTFSELRIYFPTIEGQSASMLPPPSALAWLTGPGLYHSNLATSHASDILEKPSLLPYPPTSDAAAPTFNRARNPAPDGPIPISIAISQWHWILLYPDHVIAVSRETEKVVWNESLPLANDERPVGLAADPVSRTFWIYTDRSILEIVVNKEDRDVWRAKLERGSFEEALKYASTPAQKDVVLSRQGDSLFDEGKFIPAAQCYAKSSRSFEYVTLRFVDAEERDALRLYLAGRLDRLDRRDLSQRMMLATWLVEIYLSKCNTLEDVIAAETATSDVESLTIEKQITEADLKTFMEEFKNDLDTKVVYELVLSHGRTDLYLFFANLNKDYANVIEHYVSEEQWLKAVDTLNRQTSLDLYYRFASILMRHSPKETVDSWLRQPALSPRRLIPALLLQQGVPLSSNHAVRYLSNVIYQQGSTDVTIYNLLLTFYITDSDPDDGPLIRFLSSCPDDPMTERPYYDLDYALRLCKQRGRVQPCVLIYSKMGLYECSVDLALEKGDLELAKVNADKPEDDDLLRKKLWLKIARYVVEKKKDIKSAMTFLESTDLVKIEDILPFFPDFVVIDDFKAEICTALENYSARIEELKAEMDEATASAESIKRDIESLSNRFVTIEANDKCWKCGVALITRQFYVFPCQHVFHADCLISMATEFLPAPSLRRILHLQNELMTGSTDGALTGRALLTSSAILPLSSRPGTPRAVTATAAANANQTRAPISSGTDFLLGVTGRNKLVAAGDKLRELIVPDALVQAITAVGAGVGSGLTGGVGSGGSGKRNHQTHPKTKRERERDEAKAEASRKELDGLVAGSCPLCEGVVSGLDKPFILEGEDISNWDL